MSHQLFLIPTITVHPNQINFYKEVHWDPKKPKQYDLAGNEIKKTKTYDHLLDSTRSAEGNISKVAKRKITKAIDYLLLFASDKSVHSLKTGRAFNFKIAFITLTLPSKQIHSDNEIKRKCLNSFLIELQRFYNVKRYVWRAELQKNGNIHFHIIVDKYIPWNELRNRWNRIINKLGYVDRYRDQMREFYKDGFQVREDLTDNWSELKQYRAYQANLKTDFSNPNSSDIHSIQKIRNLTSYFVKYLTKNETLEPDQSQQQNAKKSQKGRVWGASRELQNITGAKIVLDSELESELSNIINHSACKVYNADYFSVFYINFTRLRLGKSSQIFKLFTDYLISEFDYNYQLST